MATKRLIRAAAVRTRTDEDAIIFKVSAVSVAGNAALSAFKLFAGIVGNSGAMVSDAVHSLSDVLTTFIAWVGVKLSGKAADEDHPYGHERFESAASFILGIILIETAITIGKNGITEIVTGSYRTNALPTAVALVAALVSIAAKEAMFRYTKFYAKKIGSSAFMADAWHHRSDALSSIGALVGIAFCMMGFPVMDAVASLVICVFVVKVAIDIIRDALKKMLDASCGEKFDSRLENYIAVQDGVISVDMLRSRYFGNKVYVDLEIAVNGDVTLREAHSVAEKVHANVERDFPEVKHIMIHVNPAGEE